MSPLAEQIDVVFEVTEVVPFPLVETVAVKLAPTVVEVGRLLTDGVVGVKRVTGAVETVKVWGRPLAAFECDLAATWLVSVQDPADTNETLRPLAVHTLFVLDVTDFLPVPVVCTVAVNPPPTTALWGRFVMDGIDEVLASLIAGNVANPISSVTRPTAIRVTVVAQDRAITDSLIVVEFLAN